MNRNPSNARADGYQQRPIQQGYPQPSPPPQARPGPQREFIRPIMREPQPEQGYPAQGPSLQRQYSRPEQQQQLYVQQQQRPPPSPGMPNPYDGIELPSQGSSLQRQYSRPEQQQQQRPPPSPGMPNPYDRAQPPIPLPLQTSVTPAFAQRPNANDSQSTLYTASPTSSSRQMLIRGISDDAAMLPKNDVFWRRFSTSAAQEHDVEKSSWLEKTQGKSSRYGRSIWIVGIIIVILALAGIGVGVFFSLRSTSHDRPETIGGSANVAGDGGAAAAAGGNPNTRVGTGTSSSPHVSPTNVIDD
ncbi:hypothetical protein C8J57DRAFT_1279002 [Mycena rebaudengoi]|nr:hypothetical protein C8J57DRAFT_1279002 [Mycena rebaudengoi]